MGLSRPFTDLVIAKEKGDFLFRRIRAV